MPESLVVTPFALVNYDQLIGAQVAAKPLDDLRKNEVFVGEVSEVKINKFGTFARFTSPALVGAKWIKVSQIIGFAHSEESKTTAA
jgi:hypothetical protein